MLKCMYNSYSLGKQIQNVWSQQKQTKPEWKSTRGHIFYIPDMNKITDKFSNFPQKNIKFKQLVLKIIVKYVL